MGSDLFAILMFLGLIIGVFAGYRVAFVIGGVAIIVGYFAGGATIFNLLPLRVSGVMLNYVLIAVPFFIFMGVMLEISGAAENLYQSMYVWLGSIRGGLAITTILICTLLAAASGIIGATETTMGLVSLPAMIKRKYNKSLASGVILAGGSLGIIIPPSIMLVILGPTTGLSVIDLYAGAIMPGLLFSAVYIIFIIIICLIKPEMGPALSLEERNIPLKTLLLNTILYLIPPIALILLCLGTILLGVASPTEAAALGALGSIFIAALNRRFNWQILKESLYKTLRVSSMVLIIAVAASIFSGVFSSVGGARIVLDIAKNLPGGPFAILIFMMLLLILAGMLLDWFAIVLIIVPILMIISNSLGFNPIWFVVLIAVNLQISFLSPPFAYAIFYLRGIAPPEVTSADIYKGAFIFMPLQTIVVLLCMIFPEIILWLPSVFRGIK